MAWDDTQESYRERPDIPDNQQSSAEKWNAMVADQKGHSSRHEEGGSDALSLAVDQIQQFGSSVVSAITGADISPKSVNAESVDTDALNNTRYVDPSMGYEDIEAKLDSSGYVKFRAGDYYLMDGIDVGAGDLTIEIDPNAYLTFDNDANLTDVWPEEDGGNSRINRPVLLNDGHDNVHIINHGIIDCNAETFPRDIEGYDGDEGGGEGWSVYGFHHWRAENCSFYNTGVVDDAVRGWSVNDCFDCWTWGCHAEKLYEEVILATGTLGCRFFNSSSINDQPREVVNIDSLNAFYLVDGVVGAGNMMEIVEIQESPYGTVRNVFGLSGDDIPHSELDGVSEPNRLVYIDGHANNYVFTDREEIGHSNGVTVDGVFGRSSGWAINTGNTSKPIKNLTLKNLNITSSGSRGLLLHNRIEGQLDGLTVEGRIETESPDNEALYINDPNREPFEGGTFDVSLKANGDTAAYIQCCRDPSGTIRAEAPDSTAILLIAGGSNGVQMTDIDLTVYARNSDRGVFVNEWMDGSIAGKLQGVAKGNTTDIEVDDEAGEVRIDMQYDTIDDPGNNVLEADYSAL